MDATNPSSPGSAAALDGLRGSVDRNRDQMALMEESRVLLTGIIRNEIRDELRIAVAEGIAAAMTDEAAERFWSKGLDVMRRQARQKAGGFLLEGVLAGGKKLLWIGAFLLAVYSIGGWTLLKTVWAAIVPKG